MLGRNLLFHRVEQGYHNHSHTHVLYLLITVSLLLGAYVLFHSILTFLIISFQTHTHTPALSQPDKIVGIALDDLQWATVTQFRFHYNASHPLVALNIRRKKPSINSNLTSTSTTTAATASSIISATLPSSSAAAQIDVVDVTQPVSEKEFHKALPRYPNDGVLLIDVQRYNAAKVGQSVRPSVSPSVCQIVSQTVRQPEPDNQPVNPFSAITTTLPINYPSSY